MIYMMFALTWAYYMDMIKKHVDTVIVLGGILSSVLWMNGRFASIDKDIAGLKMDVVVLKTVLIMKEVMPKELAVDKEKQRKIDGSQS